ncbi:hypothetical protein ACHAXT_000076 [Thalassiosira profunda]
MSTGSNGGAGMGAGMDANGTAGGGMTTVGHDGTSAGGATGALAGEAAMDGIEWDDASGNEEDLGLLFWDELNAASTGGTTRTSSPSLDYLGGLLPATMGAGSRSNSLSANSLHNSLHSSIPEVMPASILPASATAAGIADFFAAAPGGLLGNDAGDMPVAGGGNDVAGYGDLLTAAQPQQQQLLQPPVTQQPLQQPPMHNPQQPTQPPQPPACMDAAGTASRAQSQAEPQAAPQAAPQAPPEAQANAMPTNVARPVTASAVPQAAPTIPPSAHPYYLWLLQQQAQQQAQAAQQQAQAQGITPEQQAGMNPLQLIQMLQLQQQQQNPAGGMPSLVEVTQALLQQQQQGQTQPQQMQTQAQIQPQGQTQGPVVPAGQPGPTVHSPQGPPAQTPAAVPPGNASHKRKAAGARATANNGPAGRKAKAKQATTAPKRAAASKAPPPSTPWAANEAVQRPLPVSVAALRQAAYPAVAGQPGYNGAGLPQQLAANAAGMFSQPTPMLAPSASGFPVVSASDTDGGLTDTNSATAHQKKRAKRAASANVGWHPVSSAGETTGAETEAPLTEEEERLRHNRERNREHAKNTRMRKKAYVERLKISVDELCRERDTLVSERATAANLLVEVHAKRVDVLRSFFALRAGYGVDQKRELWSGILDESSVTCRMPVTPYQSFPSSEVQVSNCQRTLAGVDAMIADAAANAVFLDSVVDRTRYPNGKVKFQYTLVTEESVVSGNQLMARWAMATLNAKRQSAGGCTELHQRGMLIAKFNSAHKIVGLEIMFDVMAFMLQVKMAMGCHNFNDVVIPNTVQTCQKRYDCPMVMTQAARPYTIVQVNERWEKLTGYARAEVVGKASCSILQGAQTTRREVDQLMGPVLYKRPACAMVTNYTKGGRRYRQYITIYPLSTDSNISHYFGLTTFVQWMDGADEEGGATKSASGGEPANRASKKPTVRQGSASQNSDQRNSSSSSSGSENQPITSVKVMTASQLRCDKQSLSSLTSSASSSSNLSRESGGGGNNGEAALPGSSSTSSMAVVAPSRRSQGDGATGASEGPRQRVVEFSPGIQVLESDSAKKMTADN